MLLPLLLLVMNLQPVRHPPQPQLQQLQLQLLQNQQPQVDIILININPKLEIFQIAKQLVEKLAISPFHTLAILTMSAWNIMAMIGAEQILVGVFALALAMKMLNQVSWSVSLTFFSTDLFLSL